MQHPALSGPYRQASEPSPDEEVIALAKLVARARRVHRLIALPMVSLSVVLSGVAYVTLRERVFEELDSRAPYLIVLLTALPLIVLAQALAAYAGRRAVMHRSRAWIAEITQRGGSPTLLEMFVRSL